MRNIEAYIQRNTVYPIADIRTGVGVLGTLETVSTLMPVRAEKYDVTNALEGDNGGISSFHINMDESDQSKFEAGDITITLSLLTTDHKVKTRIPYPQQGHFWNKLAVNELWHVFNNMTKEDDAIIGVRYDFGYYNRELDFAFIGVIDVASLYINEEQGTATFTAYSFLKRLEKIPASIVAEGVYIDGVGSHRWFEGLTQFEALNLIWDALRPFSELTQWYAIPRFELDPAYTTDVLGFGMNLYGAIEPIGDGTDMIYDFTLVSADVLQINVGNHHDVCIQLTETSAGYDLDYISTGAAGSKQMIWAQPWFLWERQTGLTESPASVDQIPRQPIYTFVEDNDIIASCIGVNLTGTSTLFIISYFTFDAGPPAITEGFYLGVANSVGLVDSGGVGYYWDYTAPATAADYIGRLPTRDDILAMEYVPSETADRYLVYFATSNKVYRIEFSLVAIIESSIVQELSDEELRYGGIYFFKNTDTILIVETTSGGGFSGLVIADPQTGITRDRRSGEIPAEDRTSEYNLDWEDIDFSKMFEISFKRDTLAGTESETAFAGITKRAPIRFFVLDSTLSECLLYTNLEVAIGYTLGAKAYITRRFGWEDVTEYYPGGTAHVETYYFNEVWGLIGDGTVGNSIIFSYNLGNSSQIRVLNLDNMTAAGAFSELARCSGAVLFDDAIVTDDGEGLVEISPRINVVSRSYLGNTTMGSREWFIDREWISWKNNVQWKQYFPVIDINFNGGKTQLAVISPTLGNLKEYFGMPKGKVEYRFIFDRHFARIRASGILSYYSAKRQQWTVVLKMERFESSGQMIRINDMIYLRHSAPDEGFPGKARVISVDYDFENRTIQVVALTEVAGTGTGDIDPSLPGTPRDQQITGGGGSGGAV